MVRWLVLSAFLCSVPLVLPSCGSQITVAQTATGGSSAITGGTSASTGGTVSGSGGQVAGTGGSTALGGTAATGGDTTDGAKTGGAATLGVTTTTGGSTSTGGVSATGGTIGTSGSSTAAVGSPETKPVGYGQNATGGGSGTPMDKATLAELQAAIDSYAGTGGLVLRYTGKFNYATITDPCAQKPKTAQILEIKRKNDITLIGAEGSAANFGVHIAATSSNIIIRNMTFGLLPGGDKSDAISIEGMTDGDPKIIWIDHNTLFSSMVDCGGDDNMFDGLIDIKKGGDRVTISYNYLHDHHKVSLNGFSEKDTIVRHVTYHHNVFENVGSRTPMQRGGYSHLFNNYIAGVTVSGINIRQEGYALIEGNYFENSKNIVTSRDSPLQGWWELKSNNITSPDDFTKFGIVWGSGTDTLRNANDWTTTKAFPISLGYTYKTDPFQCVKDGWKAVVGAGKGLATLKCN